MSDHDQDQDPDSQDPNGRTLALNAADVAGKPDAADPSDRWHEMA